MRLPSRTELRDERERRKGYSPRSQARVISLLHRVGTFNEAGLGKERWGDLAPLVEQAGSVEGLIAALESCGDSWSNWPPSPGARLPDGTITVDGKVIAVLGAQPDESTGAEP